MVYSSVPNVKSKKMHESSWYLSINILTRSHFNWRKLPIPDSILEQLERLRSKDTPRRLMIILIIE